MCIRDRLNICIVFAQLERETIQKRVTDAYYSRCQHGFHMSGAAPYGFQLELTTIEGIRTKMMKPDPETADIAKLMFEMYSQPATSFGDIARYFADEGILIYGKEMKRGFISQLLRNPIYAQADLDMYEFFKSCLLYTSGILPVPGMRGKYGTQQSYREPSNRVFLSYDSPNHSGAAAPSFVD